MTKTLILSAFFGAVYGGRAPFRSHPTADRLHRTAKKFCGSNYCIHRDRSKMVSFSCESCQDTIKKPKLDNALPFIEFQLTGSMRHGVKDPLPASTVTPPSRDEIGRATSNASRRNKSIRRETERYEIRVKELISRRKV